MCLGPLVDAGVELVPRGIERHDTQPSRAFVCCGPIVFLVHNRPSRLQANFDGSLHAWPVARVELRGRTRVEPAQKTVQMLGAAPFTDSIQAPPQRLIGLRTDEERPA